MEMTGHSCAHICVFVQTLQPRGVVKIAGGNDLVHQISVSTTAFHGHRILSHDVQQLRTDLPDLAHCHDMDKVLRTPVRPIAVCAPLLVNVEQEQCQVVALRDEEFFSDGVALICSLFGTVENAGHRQHRDDDQYLLCATQFASHDHDQHIAHLAAQLGERLVHNASRPPP